MEGNLTAKHVVNLRKEGTKGELIKAKRCILCGQIWACKRDGLYCLHIMRLGK